jgi:2-methylaconitate cis-trans-isomerase PrpF
MRHPNLLRPQPAFPPRNGSRLKIPCALLRGGTSRGPFFLASDLPPSVEERNRILMRIMGSPEFRRIDGIAGMDPVTSKLAIISASTRADADVDYLFGQASLDGTGIDFSANCGNMLSAVAPFAIERGLVRAGNPETTVRVHNVNTGSIVFVRLATPRGHVEYQGDTAIDGAPGTGAPISLDFVDAVGSKTGKLLPTGQISNRIEGVEVSCVDVAVPMAIVRAADLDCHGDETPKALNANPQLLAKLEKIRIEAGRVMGLGDCSGLVIPKICLVSAPRGKGHITSRYFTPKSCHPSHAVTGALCLAVASRLRGSVAEKMILTDAPATARQRITIEHPSGCIDADLELEEKNGEIKILRAGFIRTAAWLFDGNVFVLGER